MVTKVLCVAEKPSIAKAVANHLAGQQVPAVSVMLPFRLLYETALTSNSVTSQMRRITRTMSSSSTFPPGASAM